MQVQCQCLKMEQKHFWKMACSTINEECNVRLGGWNITESDGGMTIEWMDVDGNVLGKYSYEVKDIIEKGLEGKENFLFEAKDATERMSIPLLCLRWNLCLSVKKD